MSIINTSLFPPLFPKLNISNVKEVKLVLGQEKDGRDRLL